MVKGVVLFLFPFLLFSMLLLLPESHGQYLGETERYSFYIDENESHEIIFQSSITKFNDLIFDNDAQSIIAKVESNSTLMDTIFVYLDLHSFNEIFSKEITTLPTEMLILLDGVEQEYQVIPTSQGEDLIVWKFNNIPHITEIELIRDPNVQERDPNDEYPYGLSPIEQIKKGAALHVLKCAKGVLLYKFDMTSVACVTEKTQSELIKRGWGIKEIEFSFQKMGEYLCDKYQGNWIGKTEVCENITKKQCSLMNGVFPSPLECHGNKCTEVEKVMCHTNDGYYYQKIEGKEIYIDGLTIDRWGGSKHRYSFFTNEPYMEFNTGSGGINLEGINKQDNLNGKIVRLSGNHTERDLSIKVNDFEILGSLFPTANPTGNLIYDISMWELTNNSDQYYNQTIRVAGMLTEHEYDVAEGGVGCKDAMYTTSDEYLPDFPSSRQLNEGDKRIGVRIGTHDDLGKVEELLPIEYRENPVEILGLFVPNIIAKGDCEHVIHKSGFLLTELENIHILKPTSVYELLKEEKTFAIPYEIRSGTVDNMVFNKNSNSLKITINSNSPGNMILSLPRDLLDAKLDYCPPRNENASDDEFFVLINKQEIDFDELKKAPEIRTLKIPFQEDSINIEILGTCLI